MTPPRAEINAHDDTNRICNGADDSTASQTCQLNVKYDSSVAKRMQPSPVRKKGLTRVPRPISTPSSTEGHENQSRLSAAGTGVTAILLLTHLSFHVLVDPGVHDPLPFIDDTVTVLALVAL